MPEVTKPSGQTSTPGPSSRSPRGALVGRPPAACALVTAKHEIELMLDHGEIAAAVVGSGGERELAEAGRGHSFRMRERNAGTDTAH